MILLGIGLGIAFIYVGMSALLEDDFGLGIFAGILLVLSIVLCVSDVNSPVELTERVIVTNEPSNYGFDIIKPEEQLVRVKVTKSNSTRFGAISHDSTTYEFILQEGE